MPLKPTSRFILSRRGSRYKVKEPATKRAFSRKYMTRPRALQQMRALYAAAKRAKQAGGVLRTKRALARVAMKRRAPKDASVQKMERALSEAGVRRGRVRIVDGARGYGADGMQALMNALLQERTRQSRGLSAAELLRAREGKQRAEMWKPILKGIARSDAAKALLAMTDKDLLDIDTTRVYATRPK